MPIHVTWDNREKTRILWDIHPPWTFDEFHCAGNESRIMVAAMNLPFDLIVDANNSAPPKMGLREFRDAMQNAHPNQRFMVIVRGHKFTTMIMDILRDLGVRLTDIETMLLADTVEEARQLLEGKSHIASV